MKGKHLGACCAVAVVFISSLTFAQEKPANPPAAPTPLTFEQRHADKEAIFLLEQTDVKVNPDWSFTTAVHNKIKVLKDDAKDLGETAINYDLERDRIINQHIFTITPDGKELLPAKAQDMALNDGQQMYSNAMVRVLSMPAVVIGAVVDESYTIVSKGLPMKKVFWTMENLRLKVPVKEYRYTITFPKRLGLIYREFGLTQKPVITEKDGWITYRWVINDLYDDRQDEEYVPPPSPDDPMEAFEFSSVKSWGDFAQWYAGLIRKNTIMTPEIIVTAKAAVGDAQLTHDKVRAVLEYIQDNFRYVSMSFGENAFEPHPTTEVFANKYGDCKDLSLLTRAMLAAVGVNSHIALLNTESSINDPSYDLPIPVLFDHVILLVEDPLAGDFYADPLLKGYDIGEYPLEYQKAYTFVIADDKGTFGRLPEFDAERTAERGDQVFDINADWSSVVEASRVWSLDDSIQLRTAMKDMNNTEKKDYYDKVDFAMARGGEVIKREVEGLDRRYGRLRSTLQFRRPEDFPSADGLIVIDLDPIERNAAFEKKERREDFFFNANSISEMETIYRSPSGFETFYVPPDLAINGLNLSFIRTFKRTPLGVTVKETLRTKRVLLKKEALTELRAFYANLSRQTRQRIVFKKAR